MGRRDEFDNGASKHNYWHRMWWHMTGDKAEGGHGLSEDPPYGEDLEGFHEDHHEEHGRGLGHSHDWNHHPLKDLSL